MQLGRLTLGFALHIVTNIKPDSFKQTEGRDVYFGTISHNTANFGYMAFTGTMPQGLEKHNWDTTEESKEQRIQYLQEFKT